MLRYAAPWPPSVVVAPSAARFSARGRGRWIGFGWVRVSALVHAYGLLLQGERGGVLFGATLSPAPNRWFAEFVCSK